MDHLQQISHVWLKSLPGFLRLPEGRQQAFLASASGLALLLFLSKRLLWEIPRQKLLIDDPPMGRRAPGSSSPIFEFDEYDIIIAGGGTAGCVLASRLSEDASLKVLLIEAGGSGTSLPASRMPPRLTELYRGPHGYELYTEPQEYAGDKPRFWPRGKMLGGCSSLNGMMAHYGAASDFNEWARIIQDDSWSSKHFAKYIRKFETYTPNSEYASVNPEDHGGCGPVQVGFAPYFSPANRAFVETCPNVGIPISGSLNTDTGKTGAGRIMTFIDGKGKRVSTESAYLTPEVLARPNLTIVTHAQVTRILFNADERQPRASGVEFVQDKSGPRYHVRAAKEIIVCGGAVHSPQLLMLSGIGPADHLEEHNVSVVHDLPGVGSHLIDHPVVNLRFKDKSESSAAYLTRQWPRDIPRIIKTIVQYRLFGSGPLGSNFGQAACFFRSDDPVLFPSEKPLDPDSSSAHDTADLEIISTAVAAVDHTTPAALGLHTHAMYVVLLRPTSKGVIRLKSSDPWEPPAIDPKYLKAQRDLLALMRGVRIALRIARTAPLGDMLDHDDDKTPTLDHHRQLHLMSDKELTDFVRERVDTVYHPASTCRMAPSTEEGVVDAKLRVYGVHGLRVCDASVFPSLVSGHPTGAVIAIAEKLADIIKGEYTTLVSP